MKGIASTMFRMVRFEVEAKSSGVFGSCSQLTMPLVKPHRTWRVLEDGKVIARGFINQGRIILENEIHTTRGKTYIWEVEPRADSSHGRSTETAEDYRDMVPEQQLASETAEPPDASKWWPVFGEWLDQMEGKD
jgi:hypothetical protein